MSNPKPNRKLRVLCGFLALFTANQAVAEGALVSPDVVAVVEGGHWTEDGLGEGSYRVVVVSQGFEHVSSRVVAEWKLAPSERGQARIVHSVELVNGGFYSFGEPEISVSAGQTIVELKGTATYSPGKTVVCRFGLVPGGGILSIKACGD
jgi:hypothetical protein